MHARFYAPDADATGDLATLPGDEAEHLTRVLRLKAGDAVVVFNGRGGEFQAVVEDAGKRGAQVRVGVPSDAAPEPRVRLTIAHAVLKGDKMDDVVRDAVMMGAAGIQPLITSRTEIATAALERSHRRERWQRIAIASSKQCGRAVVPTIGDPRLFEWVPSALTSKALPTPALMLVEPSAASSAVPLGHVDGNAPAEATLLVGPEGGWAAEELEAAAAVCCFVTLGQRTLRADAMAIVGMAALFAKWQEF